MGTKKVVKAGPETLKGLAEDINEVLKPTGEDGKTPAPLDLESPNLEAEVKELFPAIKAGDGLQPESWATLKAMGWTDGKAKA
ncbi:MAG: hypothetical protein V2A34_12735, partial [Lentisphaerota bacterium]